PGRRPGARAARGRRPRPLRVRHRRRSRRRVPAAVGDRGHRARAGARARARLARPRGRPVGAEWHHGPRHPLRAGRQGCRADRRVPHWRAARVTSATGALESHLRARREAGCKLLVPYVTGGLGSGWLDVVRAIADGGADAADAHDVETVLLAAPTTPDDRLVAICERTRGFVYGVSLMGVTGERAMLATQAAEMGRRLKAVTDKPVLLGIGISNAAQAVEAAQYGDGVIIGSALITRVLQAGGPDTAQEFVGELR